MFGFFKRKRPTLPKEFFVAQTGRSELSAPTTTRRPSAQKPAVVYYPEQAMAPLERRELPPIVNAQIAAQNARAAHDGSAAFLIGMAAGTLLGEGHSFSPPDNCSSGNTESSSDTSSSDSSSSSDSGSCDSGSSSGDF